MPWSWRRRAIVGAEADVFAPCALGAVIDDQRACRALPPRWSPGRPTTSWPRTGTAPRLKARGILYAPDYVINAGGLIHVAAERFGHDAAWEEGKGGRASAGP